MGDADDPYGMFDDDDSDDNDVSCSKDEGQTGSSGDKARSLAQTLLAHANQQGNNDIENSRKIQENGHTSLNRVSTLATETTNDTEFRGENLVLPWRNPLYQHPGIQLVSELPGIGGGRGYISACSLSPGALVLAERPALVWSDCHTFSYHTTPEENVVDFLPTLMALLSPLFERGNKSELVRNDKMSLLHELEHFHPTKTVIDNLFEETNEDNFVVAEPGRFSRLKLKRNKQKSTCDAELNIQVIQQIKNLQDRYNDCKKFNDLLLAAKESSIFNSDSTVLSRCDALRLLLAFRYNGLQTGLYLHTAMLNHGDIPNCVKFMPHDADISEVRATREIRKGEVLTISYVPALPITILSHASRRKYLWKQHFFDIGPADQIQPIFLKDTEWVHGCLPESSVDSDDDDDKEEETDGANECNFPSFVSRCTRVTRRIEHAISELRVLYVACEEQIKLSVINATGFDHCKALEQTALEMCREAEEQLGNGSHILILSCLELHLDSALLVLDMCSKKLPLSVVPVTNSQRKRLLQRIITTAMQLLELQERVWGSDHFALARTNLDLAQAIEELLSKSPKHLLELTREFRGQKLDTVSAWSTREHHARQEHARVEAIYSETIASDYS